MRAREAGLWALSWGSAIAVCAALGGLLSFLLARGVPTLGPALLFGSTPPMEAILALKPVWDGIWPAMLGTLSLLAVTMALALVPGIGCGIYLACYAPPRKKQALETAVDVLAGNKFVEDAAEFMGKELPVRVTKVEKAKGKATFSHKILLNEEKQKKIDAAWDKISEGDIIEGTVMRFEDYGAFVDVGDIDGLLHISEISWGKLKHPQEVLTKGEKIMVKVFSTNSLDRKSVV